MGEYAQLWLTRQVHLKPSTRSRYTALVGVHIAPAFGSVPLANVELSDVASWVVELVEARGAASGSIRRSAHHLFHRGR